MIRDASANGAGMLSDAASYSVWADVAHSVGVFNRRV